MTVDGSRFECPRCGSGEWDYCDYGGCSDCRPYEDRAAEHEEDSVATWVAWAITTPLKHGLTSFGCGDDSKKAGSQCGGLRLVPIPERFQPSYVNGSSFDPDTLRLAAQTHADHHALSGSFTLKPWVVLYLLAVWEAATEAAKQHMFTTSGHPKSHHVVDRLLYETLTGRDWKEERYAKEGPVVDV